MIELGMMTGGGLKNGPRKLGRRSWHSMETNFRHGICVPFTKLQECIILDANKCKIKGEKSGRHEIESIYFLQNCFFRAGSIWKLNI